ncbi:MAG TPA: hypothetical protein VFI29_03895 [Hanamia sp.]|nr:hypothetical protein [Hanamia sp.]
MSNKKENLIKLLEFIDEVSNEPGNEWFKEKLYTKFREPNSPAIDEIYEYCIRKIIADQADKFYNDFKLLPIKEKLIKDFIRMEQFRREDNFEDFCLGMHQQFEAIVNFLCDTQEEFCNKIILDKNKPAYRIKNKDKTYSEYKLWQLILTTFKTQDDANKIFDQKIIRWEYPFKLKAVIYYYCFDGKIWDYFRFKDYYDLLNEIYQSRNLNHRGGYQTENQKLITLRILSEKHKYYFKFLGLLEDFTTKTNSKTIILCS